MISKLNNFKIEVATETIRTVPHNYWIATIRKNKLIFDSWDGAIVGRYDKKEVEKFYLKNTKLFKFSFVGRKAGAIGIFYKINTSIRATDKQHALNLLYTDYEHIQGLKMNGEILSF